MGRAPVGAWNSMSPLGARLGSAVGRALPQTRVGSQGLTTQPWLAWTQQRSLYPCLCFCLERWD